MSDETEELIESLFAKAEAALRCETQRQEAQGNLGPGEQGPVEEGGKTSTKTSTK